MHDPQLPDTTTQSFIDGAFSAALMIWGGGPDDIKTWANAAARDCEHWWSHRLSADPAETAQMRWLAVARAIRANWCAGLRQGDITVLGVGMAYRAQSALGARGETIVAWLRRTANVGEPVGPLPAAVARHLLDHTSDMLVLTNARREIVWVNQRFEQFTGHALSDVRGRSPGEVLRGPETSDETLRWSRERLSSGKGVRDVDIVFHTRAGRPYWARLSIDPIIDAEGQIAGFIDFQSDVSWEHELREAAQRQAQLPVAARGIDRLGTWEHDLVTARGQWDLQARRLLGYGPAQDIADFDAAMLHIHPDDADKGRRAWRETVTRIGRGDLRLRVRAPDGGYRNVRMLWDVLPGPGGEPRHVKGAVVDDSAAPVALRTVPDLAAQFDLAVDLAQIYIWRHDLETDIFHYNEATFRALGLPLTPDLSLPLAKVRSLVHPLDVAAVAAAAERARQTATPITVEARYRRGDGSYRTMLTRRVAQRDEHGRPVALLGVAMDVTERVSEQMRSRALSDRLEMIAQAAGVGVWSIDLESGRSEWNLEMFRLYGLPDPQGAEGAVVPGPAVRDWMGKLVHPDDSARLASERRRSWAENEPMFDIEFRILRPDGEVRWVACRSRREVWQGRDVTFGIHLDVTDRRAAEEALRSARERTALATQLAGVGTWEWDLVTDAMHWDEQMYALCGVPPSERPEPKRIREVAVHPEDLAVLQERERQALAEGGTHESEFRVCWPDGTVHWLASRSTVLTDPDGKPVRMLGVNWDVTEHRRAVEAHQARLSAEEANRAKSDFLARMSHELRTPLNAVLGFTQLLQADGAETLSLRQRSKLAHVHAAAEHLLALINDILDLVRVEAGAHRVEQAPVSVRELVDEGLHLIEPLAHMHQVQLLAGEVDGWVLGDRTRLRQVLINLLSNAVKYNRTQGTIWVSVRVPDQPPSGGLPASGVAPDADGGWLVLQVRDSGRGMTAEQIDRLFDPFDRLGVERDGIEGTGIGMSIVQHLVERMGGLVQVRSQPGAGTEFEVWLRRTEPPIVQVEPPAQPVARPIDDAFPQRGLLHIVYIEDNPVNALLIEELVALRTGVVLSVAPDGTSGVERVRELHPDLVLIDMQLPDIDGFEVLRRLRSDPTTANLRCVALSANALPSDITRALAAGFEDYWTKPIEFSAFMGHLDDLVEQRRRGMAAAH